MSQTATITLAELRTVDLFDDIDDSQLERWLAVAKPRLAEAEAIIAEQDEDMLGVQLLLEGSVRSLMVDRTRGRTEPIGHQDAPTWMGAIAVLTGGSLGVRIQCITPCRIAVIDAPDFRRLALSEPMVHRKVMQQVAPVMSRLTGIEHNRERLASLGTMAAGLAHELNNPAAAARRVAAQMSDVMSVISGAIAGFVNSGIEREDAQALVALQQEAAARAASASALDTLDAADAEDELLERLEALGVEEAWQLAEPLAAAGLDQDWLDRVATHAGRGTGKALGWVAATLTGDRLVAELQESTERMSGLVGAVKSYAYMDRGDLIEVDLHEGLDTTLVVLGHKLKHTAIEVKRCYDRDLPRLTVRGSELNQVWTNLLDNAIDALGETGRITITTSADGNCAVVEIADDGPGIPDAARDRIFDPFFTTKGVGEGTGLGLATARRIVVDRHDGSLTVESAPGRTAFRIRIPFKQRAEAPVETNGDAPR